MPRIKRFFPLSHDINSDPLCWEMTERFGDRTFRMWLELESLSDRNEGELPEASEAFLRSLASKCQIAAATAQKVWVYLVDKAKITRDIPPRWVNYADFHHSREQTKLPASKQIKPLPTSPTEPDQNKLRRTEARKHATALSKEFVLSDDMKQFAVERGISSVEVEFDKFRAHHEAKGNIFQNWTAAWRTWVLHAVEYRERNGAATDYGAAVDHAYNESSDS